MRYAEVAVDAPIGYGKTLSYGIIHESDVSRGQLVWVPLGTRLARGIVFDLSEEPQVEPVRYIVGAVAAPPLVGPVGLDLARWISRHYMCSLFDAVAPMLPPGFQERVRPFLRLATQREFDSPPLAPPKRRC